MVVRWRREKEEGVGGVEGKEKEEKCRGGWDGGGDCDDGSGEEEGEKRGEW